MPSDASPPGPGDDRPPIENVPPAEASEQTRGVEHRLHPSSALFALISSLRGFLFPFVLLVFFSRGSSALVYVSLFGVVPAMIAFFVKFVSYRYRLDRDELVIRDGILTRNERHIPYARIQNIDLLQNPLHRMFGVAEARLETASGGKPEAVIRVLSLDAVGEMRRRVFAERHAAEPNVQGLAEDAGAETSVTQPPPLVHLPLREVVIYGLISNRGMVVVAAALGLLSQSGLWDFGDEEWMGQITSGAADRLNLDVLEHRATQIAIVVVASVVGLILLMRLLSVALAVFRFYDFTLTRRGDDLRAEYGLFTRVSQTIPIHRIQTVSTRQGLLHRWAGRTAVQMETAGGGGVPGDGDDGGNQAIERQWLAPILPSEQVAALVRGILPEIDLDTPAWEPIEFRGWRRRVKPLIFLALLVAVGAGFGVHPAAALLAIPIVVLAVYWARGSVAAEAWALSSHAVYYKSGWVGRFRSVVRYGKIQGLARFESPFDRRHRMAQVHVDTAGAARIGHRVQIPYLTTETADGILDRLFDEASQTAFRW